jgi:hypothetical protein
MVYSDIKTHCGSPSPSVRFQMLLHELGPGVVKKSKILTFTHAAPEFSIKILNTVRIRFVSPQRIA